MSDFGTAWNGCIGCSKTPRYWAVSSIRCLGGRPAGSGVPRAPTIARESVGSEAKDDNAHEMAVTACGLAKAAEILAGRFTLVATNVPYLGRGKQDEVLQKHCEQAYPDSKADLATCFVERCLAFCSVASSAALVTPQSWLFLTSYRKLRQELLHRTRWDFVFKLGSRAFETIGGDVVNVVLMCASSDWPPSGHMFAGLDASDQKNPLDKAKFLLLQPPIQLSQENQLENPDARVVLSTFSRIPLLSSAAEASHGQGSFDSPRFSIAFWELNSVRDGWVAQQSSPATTQEFGGCHFLFRWEDGEGALAEMMEAKREQGYSSGKWKAGVSEWGKLGVLVGQMGELPCTLYLGKAFDENASVIIPHDPSELSALWAFCTSDEFRPALKELDQSIKITCKTLIKVPFDRPKWQKIAAEKYPHGLPKPHSDDPTQWLFNGHPNGSDQPLHVAVARLLGYRWPRQTGTSFPDCPVLGPDELGELADDDGIVCLSATKGEAPAAERVRGSATEGAG